MDRDEMHGLLIILLAVFDELTRSIAVPESRTQNKPSNSWLQQRMDAFKV